MPSTELFAADAAWWCDSGNLGYGQDTRDHFWPGGATDCSNLVRYCGEHRGFDMGAQEAGVFYTGNMRALLTARGWVAYAPGSVDLRVGDILLAEGEHTEVYVGAYGQNGPLAGAMINEIGDIVGGADGDQTDRETSTHAYYDYPWTHVLRYEGGTGSAGGAGASSGNGNGNGHEDEENELTNEQARKLDEIHWIMKHLMEGPETNSDVFISEQRRWRDQVNATLAGLQAAINELKSR